MEATTPSDGQKFGVIGASSPMQAIFWLTTAYILPRTLYVAVELNIADRIRDGHDDIKSLAEVTNSDPGYLYRVMRTLAGQGVFEEHEGKRFSLTPMSEILRTDSPENFGAYIKLVSNDVIWNSTAGLANCVRSGGIAFDQVMDEHWTEYMSTDQAFADDFHAGMKSTTILFNPAIAEAYDFSSCRHVVDIGGGSGALLSLILNEYENIEGTLFDLENAIEQARKGAGGTLPRCNFVAGDFFKEVPAGGDTYLIKIVLHDWGDDDCVRILQNCKSAMADGGRILVIERLIGEPNVPSLSHIADVNMMIWTGGQERTEAEFENLFHRAGLRRSRTMKSGSDYFIIEAVSDT